MVVSNSEMELNKFEIDRNATLANKLALCRLEFGGWSI